MHPNNIMMNKIDYQKMKDHRITTSFCQKICQLQSQFPYFQQVDWLIDWFWEYNYFRWQNSRSYLLSLLVIRILTHSLSYVAVLTKTLSLLSKQRISWTGRIELMWRIRWKGRIKFKFFTSALSFTHSILHSDSVFHSDSVLQLDSIVHTDSVLCSLRLHSSLWLRFVTHKLLFMHYQLDYSTF